MTAAELLSALAALGVKVEAAGGRLRLDAPRGVLTADLRAAVVARREELLALLARGPDAALAEALALIDQASAREQRPARRNVLAVYCTLAGRYHREGEALLFGVAPAVRALLGRRVEGPLPGACREGRSKGRAERGVQDMIRIVGNDDAPSACLLCGRPPANLLVWVPKVRLAAPQGRVRAAVCALCKGCGRTGMAALRRAEGLILAGLAAPSN